jgi:RNA polymerase sigma-70 factor (ECF subfamily)
MTTGPQPTSPAAADAGQWQRILDGDREAFNAAVRPYVPELSAAIGRELRYHRALGTLEPDNPTVEEVIADVLDRAWRDRHRRPTGLHLRVWLLGLTFRMLERLVQREERRRAAAAVSLEEPVPDQPGEDDETFWEWYQPDETVRWEDVIPAPNASLPDEILADVEAASRRLPAQHRRVFLLRMFHRLRLVEVAAALRLAPDEASRLLADAQEMIASARTNGPS